MLNQQYSLLKEKAKLSWVKKGDRNTALFHAAIKIRASQQGGKVLLPDGSQSDDVDTVDNASLQHFSALLGAHSDIVDINLVDNDNDTVTDMENNELCTTSSLEDIKEVILSMDSSSSPGPDRYTSLFYKTAWEIIKTDLYKAVEMFFRGFPIPRIISCTHLILLKMDTSTSGLQNLRPISLCNVIHKILSKLLYNRLSKAILKIIRPEQVGFMPNRDIQNNISLAHDLVQDIHKRIYGGNVLIKLDMSKAYDRLYLLGIHSKSAPVVRIFSSMVQPDLSSYI